MTVLIRPRRDDDLPALGRVLIEQQPQSRYPFTWDSGRDTAPFIRRGREVAAWVAEEGGCPVGHVSVQRGRDAAGLAAIGDEGLADAWMRAHGCAAGEIGVVSALFTAASVRGAGVGSALLDAAVIWCRESDLRPSLDVVQTAGPAVDMYRRRGWVVVGESRPDWLPPAEPPVLAMVLRG